MAGKRQIRKEGSMTPEDNKQSARRMVEIINAGDLGLVDELFAPDYVERAPPPGIPPDREGFKALIPMLRAAFPDLRYTIEDEVAEGNKVAQRVIGRGTMKGEFMGMSPTGKTAEWQEMHLHRFNADGKLAEHWQTSDELGMMMQLGLDAQPPPAAY
jgi:predicted ester cyclase